ncbi:MAG: ABC transporter permease subunit [Rhodoglobus sp.]
MTNFVPLYRRALGDSWRGLVGWSLGFAAAIMLYVPLYASFGATPQIQEMIASLPPAMTKAMGFEAIGTGSGYVHSTVYGLVGLALLVIAATSWSTAAIAGDEETGSLELTLAHGVTRTQVVLERTAALVTRLAWLVLITIGLVLALNDSAGLGLEMGNLMAEAAAFLGLALVSATVGLAVGAATGRRAYASAGAAGIAVLGYTLNAVGNQSSDLEWVHSVSPYAWAYGNLPLTNGVDWTGLGLLYGASAVLVVVAVVALNRRDIAG